MDTGEHVMGKDLPEPSYGHACLVTEINGQLGVLVTGGALTGCISIHIKSVLESSHDKYFIVNLKM